jgi:hypothetical protein
VGATSGGTAIGTLSYQRRPEAVGLPVRLTPRLILAGREPLLGDLDARLAPDPGRPGPRVVVLCGLGGVGKTSVAVEFAYRQLGGVGACWQFSAEDPAVLAAEFSVLAAELGAREVVDPRDPVASVHAVLARQAAGWLVVLDNAADLASVEAFIPPAGPGRVIITSQNQHWPPGWAVYVPELDVEIAAEFLVARTGDADQGAAVELAEGVGGLPLALEQAAAYMQATGTSLTEYVGLFRERQAELLARGEAAGHRKHVAATLSLALSKLEAEAPAAAGLVRLLAFLAPAPVPFRLLLANKQAEAELPAGMAHLVGPLLGDAVATGDAVAAVRRYSLAAPVGDGLVQVHRLVQAITRDRFSAEDAAQWEQAATALVDGAIPANPMLSTVWPVFAVLLPHARAALGLTISGIRRIALYLGWSGSYPAARDLFVLIADAYRDSSDHGPKHRDTLAVRNQVAIWTGMAGDAAGARDQFAALLPVLERVQGAEDPDTLSARANLATWTGNAGDAAGARDQLAALLPVLERVQGAEHPEILSTRHQLATWTGMAGDAAGARDQLAALFPVLECRHSRNSPGV